MSSSIEDFNFSVNVLSALIWRDNEGANFQSLLQSKQNWYQQNHTQFWTDWCNNVFNIDTANDFGLSVWAQILGVPLNLIVAPNNGPQFGFDSPQLLTDRADAGTSWTTNNGAVITAGQADPNGGTSAVLLDFSAATANPKVSLTPIAGGIPASPTTLTFQAKLISGTQGTVASDINGVTMGNWPALSSSAWTTVTLNLTNATAGTTVFNLVTATVSRAKIAVFNPSMQSNGANGRQNFNNGNFASSAAGVGLTTDQKRILLKLKYYKLISRCTVPEINARMKAILGKYGSVYVLDGNNMRYVTYVFGFAPNSALQFVLENFDVLPRPAAVGVKYIVSTRPAFGFGSSNQNFNNGTFWAEN